MESSFQSPYNVYRFLTRPITMEVVGILPYIAFSVKRNRPGKMNISKTKFGAIADQDIYSLEMSNGELKILISNFGASILAIQVPDSKGNVANVVLGYASLKEYQEDPFYMGAVVGRFAGRISNGTFVINDRKFQLARNAGNTGNHIHGGLSGFNKRVFRIEHVACCKDAVTVQFYYRSEAMEEGYPGNLDVWVSYSLTNDNDLIISYEAVTDEATHVNLTNHSYFNLSGRKGKVLDHELFIYSKKCLDDDDDDIPSGAVKPVRDTPYDFAKLRRIDRYSGHRAPAYNHYFILKENGSPDAILFDPDSKRKMTVKTSFPGIMLYTGDFLSGKFKKCQGLCLETQFFPDTPNRPEFPSTLLYPDQKFNHQTSFKFSW